MKKTTISVQFEDEKLAALRLYLSQKDTRIEDELAKAIDELYERYVPAGVREYFDLKTLSTDTPLSIRPGKPQGESRLTESRTVEPRVVIPRSVQNGGKTE